MPAMLPTIAIAPGTTDSAAASKDTKYVTRKSIAMYHLLLGL